MKHLLKANPSQKIFLTLAAIVVLAAILFGAYARKSSLDNDLQLYSLLLQRDSISFNRGLDQLTSITRQLVNNPLLVTILDRIDRQRRPTDIAGKMVTRTLEATAMIENVSSAYLMDTNGNCVYSSKPAFVGNNYGFRPYFKAALADKPMLYTAIGVTSKKLGIYYARPVITGGRTVGVVVLKIVPSFFNIAPFSAAFVTQPPKPSDLQVGLLSENGIFISLRGHSLYSLEPLSPEQRKQFGESRQYPPDQIKSLGFPPDTFSKLATEATVEVQDKTGTCFIIFHTPLRFGHLSLVHIVKYDWLRLAFHPASSIFKLFFMISAGLLCLLLVLLYVLNRRHREFVATSRRLEQANLQRIADQERYETIINNSPVGFILRSKDDNKVITANPSLCKLLGRTEEEVRANGLEAYISDTGFRCFDAEPDANNPGVIETQITRSDGRRRSIVIHSACFHDHINNTAYCCGFIVDMTDQQEQHAQLQLFSQIIEQVTSSVVITDTSGSILYTNPFFSRLTGYAPEEVRGCNPRILSAGTAPRETYEDLWKTVLSGETWRGVFQNRKKDGSLYDEGTIIYPVEDASGRITHLVAIKNDITERLALERKLTAQAGQLDIIAEHVPIGLARVADHSFLWISRQGASMYEYTRDEASKLHTSELFEDENSFKYVSDGARQAFARNEIFFENEVRMRRRDGSLFWCRLIGKLIDQDNPESGAVWLTLNIEEEREQKKILENARDQARMANKAKSSFLANMSHEIRTPLSSIIGMGNLLTETSLTEEQQLMLGNIRTSSSFLLRLINDILDFSKIEAGKLQLDPSPFKLQTCLADVTQTMHSTIVTKGLDFKQSLADDLPECVIADEFRLKQILLNLLSNAVKFTENGHVGMDVTVSKEPEDNQLRLFFKITDTGVGIKPEHRKAIFDTFTQADSSITRKFGGTGLGLTISSQLCRMMGGEIRVESTPGKGSCFSFSITCSLPSADDQEMVIELDERLQQRLPHLNILLVDDNSSNRFLARIILTAGDEHQVTEAGSGVEALQELGKQYFDLILMDVRMPLLDGITTTTIIRACENRQNKPEHEQLPDDLWQDLCKRIRDIHIPIIALTADAMLEDKNACLKVGMDGYLAKPFSREELFTAIKQVMPREHELTGTTHESDNLKKNIHTTESDSTMEDICRDVTDHLQKTYGLEDGDLAKMCRLSAETLVQSLEKAEKALASSDMETLSAAAHKAKGSLLAMGLETDSEQARQMEAGAKSGEELEYAVLLTRLREHLEPLFNKYVP